MNMADHSTSSQGEGGIDHELQRTVVSSTIWNISSPPSSSSVNALIPKALQKTKPRKLSLEIHKVKIADETSDNSREQAHYEECIVRIWAPDKSQRRLFSSRHLPAASVASEHDEDDETLVPVELLSSDVVLPGLVGTHTMKYQLPLRSLTVKKASNNTISLSIEQNRVKRNHLAIFESTEKANEFLTDFKKQKDLEGERLDRKMQTTLNVSNIRLKPDEKKLDLLIEIVSGWNLPIADLSSSDPFVVCSINGQEVHHTKYISKTLDPIWTLQTGSFFILTIDLKDMFSGDGLFCRVVDYDVISNDDLGFFVVPPNILYKGNGEREVFKLRPPPRSKKREVPGYLAIRCRRATQYDKEFLEEFKASHTEKSDNVANTLSIARAAEGGRSNLRSVMTKNAKIDKDGNKRYKIRPGPDPKRKLETQWMTADEIEYECAKESQHWIDSGSGKMGKIFVEILGCDNLPNLDSGGFLGNKTDAFVSLVLEDSVVQTDIIDDSLSPRWLPWSKRAFIFHVSHSSSQLFVGVFDNDLGMDGHDLVGRVSVDMTNLRRDTIYTLKYDIFKSSQMSERKARGSVTLRLRMDIHDERKLLLACLEPPLDIYVNVKTRKDFRVLRWTTQGKYDMEQYSMKVMNSYIEELLSYQQVLYYAEDATISLLMWRSQAEFSIMGKTISLPLHSLIAFLSFTSLVEKPELIPSFFCFSVAWFMFAVMSFRRKAPNPWIRCRSYAEIFKILVFGQSMVPPDSIACNENFEQSKAAIEEWEKRLVETEERTRKNHEEAIKAQEEYEKDLAEIGEATTDISTKSGRMNMDIFKPIFFPIQKNLSLACRCLRALRAVVTWDECYFAFWVTTLAVAMGFAFLFVPWFSLLKWTARIVVWSIFGPWMILIDKFYYSRIQPLSDDELEQREAQHRARRQEMTSRAATANRIKRENAAKLRDIKRFMFGDFIWRVPILKADRHRDMPRPESEAVPYQPRPLPLAELAMKEAGYHRTRLPGQHLKGDMIPRVETAAFTDAPLGQATARPNLLDKAGPGGSAPAGSESTAAVYAKLGSLVTAATLVTWFGVPLLSKLTEEALRSAIG